MWIGPTKLRSSLFAFSLVALGSSYLATSGIAADFVVGGYQGSTDTTLSTTFVGPEMQHFRASEPSNESGFVFDFTPRQQSSTIGNILSYVPARRLVVGAGTNDPSTMTNSFSRVGLAGESENSGKFSIGGALEFESFSVLGGYSRVDLIGGAADVVSAGVDYGPVSAKLAFGQTDETGEGGPSDLLMFRTDLATHSWLTFESELAFGSHEEEDSMAAGRVGLRLEF